ncbi:hypothetical protein PROFUN_05646 [Planoprotostelium fungivorum]|uniref:Stress-response A/B barrel domain-containing protein n=1 Tax=Planoprotostelium fungivorum TaxID=1890364 RepID=A0A2P6MUE1_9EUKA|nr:hypothetical protein PROFUN_05646 [Planoprotostelium fungivorum]
MRNNFFLFFVVGLAVSQSCLNVGCGTNVSGPVSVTPNERIIERIHSAALSMDSERSPFGVDVDTGCSCGSSDEYCMRSKGCVSGCWDDITTVQETLTEEDTSSYSTTLDSTAYSTTSSADESTALAPEGSVHRVVQYRFVSSISIRFIFLRYNDSVGEDDIASIQKAFFRLNEKATKNGTRYVQIVGGVDDAFRHGFVLTFESLADHDYFMNVDPAYQQFLRYLQRFLADGDNTVSFDFQNEGYQSWLTRETSGNLWHHDISFRYKEGVTQEEVDSVTQAYLEVGYKSIRDGRSYVNIAGGTMIGVQGMNENFRNGFILSFTSEDDMNFFECCEKAHQEFGDFMGQYVIEGPYHVGFDFKEEQ